MSPKGIQPTKVTGLQAVLKPATLCPLACRDCITAGNMVLTQTGATAPRKLAIEGLLPPGRKKFVNAGVTHGRPLLGLTPQGAAPVPTSSGPAAALELGSL